MLCNPISRLTPQSGIAIGPILFIIAMLAVLAAAMSSGMSGFGQAGITDRVAADIVSQANLLRAKISECNAINGTNENYDGYPSSLVSGSAAPIAVSTVKCDGDPAGQQNLWTGARATSYPPPTSGFNGWQYINTNETGLKGTADGGRCIFITPSGTSPKSNVALVAGLKKASLKFTSAASNDGASEVNYDPTSVSQKFILWVSPPPAIGSEDSHCKP